jgi:hypothetical protein
VLLSDRAPPVSTVTSMASDPNLVLSTLQHVKYPCLDLIQIAINSSLDLLHNDSDIPPSSHDSKFASKISALESKMDSKFDNVDSKFEILEKDIKHIVVELKAEMGKQETRFAWGIFFSVSVVLISPCPTF